jgi:hypothetical protein
VTQFVRRLWAAGCRPFILDGSTPVLPPAIGAWCNSSLVTSKRKPGTLLNSLANKVNGVLAMFE